MKLSASMSFEGYTPFEIITAIAEAGFDGCGLVWKHSITSQQWKQLAIEKRKALGLTLSYVHGPWGRISRLWRQDDAANPVLDRLLQCLHAAADAEAPMVVLHSYIGFRDKDPVSQMGIDRFGILVREAEKLGLQIAFENLEGEPYLAALMGAFCREKHVGFCWDTGHELCYNGGRDQMALYGDRLLCTHLNDNLGCHSSPSPAEDLHLLPFDGLADWQDIASRLDAVGYDGALNFELTANSKPGRHENDTYRAMGLQAFAKLAYERACRVAALRKG